MIRLVSAKCSPPKQIQHGPLLCFWARTFYFVFSTAPFLCVIWYALLCFHLCLFCYPLLFSIICLPYTYCTRFSTFWYSFCLPFSLLSAVLFLHLFPFCAFLSFLFSLLYPVIFLLLYLSINLLLLYFFLYPVRHFFPIRNRTPL